ncbi:MAG: HU family DNA-binding protein [Clostridiales bacterium]|nr:HU family DNA-binding protein [Clostridiales bacterium]
MNKAELISATAEKTGLSKKDTEKTVNAILETITETLKAGEKVQVVGFGVFDVKYRQARIGHNPRTKEQIKIPATRAPQFKPGKALKEAVAK